MPMQFMMRFWLRMLKQRTPVVLNPGKHTGGAGAADDKYKTHSWTESVGPGHTIEHQTINIFDLLDDPGLGKGLVGRRK